jgi:hypothetical protein
VISTGIVPGSFEQIDKGRIEIPPDDLLSFCRPNTRKEIYDEEVFEYLGSTTGAGLVRFP